ncbi:MAG: extracellular solute-binding protein [Arachnia sp.]
MALSLPRRLTTGAVAASMALTLAACTGGDSPGDGQSNQATSSAPGPEALAAADGVVEVTFWHSFGGAAGEALDSLITDFNAENDGIIKVEAAYQGSYTDMLAKYAASLRDNSNPTVIIAGDTTSGYLRAVEHSQSPAAMAAANPDDLDLSELREAAANYYSADGELFAVPMAASTPIVWVNPTILEQAGVDPDVSLESITDVYNVAKQVTENTDAAGLVLHYDGWWFEQPTAMAGGDYCTPGNGRGAEGDATALSLTSDAQVAAFSELSKIYLDGYGLDVGSDYAAAMSAFGGGQAAMLLFSSGAAGTIIESGVEFDTRAFPSFGSEQGGTVVGGNALWLSSTAQDAEKVAGWKLISYLASAPAQETFSQATGYVAINSLVDDSPTQQAYLEEHPYAGVFADQLDSSPATTATAGCLSGAMTGIREAVVPQMQAIFTGNVSLEDGLAAAESDANQAIEDYLAQAGE